MKWFVFAVGWGKSSNVQGFGEGPSTKAQIFNLLHSIRTVARGKFTGISEQVCMIIVFAYLSVPLILLNVLTISLKLILG